MAYASGVDAFALNLVRRVSLPWPFLPEADLLVVLSASTGNRQLAARPVSFPCLILIRLLPRLTTVFFSFRTAAAYLAAKNAGNNFKLFFSFDMR
jgi:hypothetical protein